MPEPTIEDLAARVTALEQQMSRLLTTPPKRRPPKAGGATFEQLFGAGKDLWDSEEDFENFIKLLAERRKMG